MTIAAVAAVSIAVGLIVGYILGGSRAQTRNQQAAIDANLAATRAAAERAEQTAGKLRDLFRHDFKRGQWGERTLEKLLADAGMIENRDYYRQKTIPGGKRPDIVLSFPDGTGQERLLPVDAKFPMPSSAVDEDGDKQDINDYRKKARSAAKALAAKEYAFIPGGLGWTIMYIPSDGLYAALTEKENPYEPSVVEEASDMRVLMLPPSSFLAAASLMAEIGRASSTDHVRLLADTERFLKSEAPGMSADVIKAVKTARNALDRIVKRTDKFDKHCNRISRPIENAVEENTDRYSVLSEDEETAGVLAVEDFFAAEAHA